MLRRLLLTSVLGSIMVAGTLGAAAALEVRGLTSQAGSTTVDFATCDDTVTAYLDDISEAGPFTASSVAVTGIAVACQGRELHVRVEDGEGNVRGQGVDTIQSTHERVTLDIPVLIEDAEEIHVAIIG